MAWNWLSGGNPNQNPPNPNPNGNPNGNGNGNPETEGTKSTIGGTPTAAQMYAEQRMRANNDSFQKHIVRLKESGQLSQSIALAISASENQAQTLPRTIQNAHNKSTNQQQFEQQHVMQDDMFADLDVNECEAAEKIKKQQKHESGFDFIQNQEHTQMQQCVTDGETNNMEKEEAITQENSTQRALPSSETLLNQDAASKVHAIASDRSLKDENAKTFSDDDCMHNAERALNTLKVGLVSQLDSLWDALCNSLEAVIEHRVRVVDNANKVIELKKSIAKLEEAQSSAVLNEDYEAADAIDMELIGVRKRLEHALASDARIGTSSASPSLGIAEKNLTDALNSEANMVSGKLSDEASKLDTFIAIAMRHHEVKIESINESIDENTALTEQLNSELKLLQQNELSINTFIERESTAITLQRDELLSKKEELNSEIESIRLLLEQKEKELASCQSNIEAANLKLSSIRSQHDFKLNALTESQQQLARDHDVAKAMTASLTSKRSELVEAAQNLQQRHAAWLADVRSTDNVLDKQQHLLELLHPILHSESSSIVLPEPDDHVIFLRNELHGTVDNETRLKSDLAELEAAVEKHRHMLALLIDRIPLAESEKILAVANKDFKKAALLSREIKEIAVERDGIAATISEMRMRLVDVNTQLDSLYAKRSQLHRDLSDAEQFAEQHLLKELQHELEFTHSQEQAILSSFELCTSETFSKQLNSVLTVLRKRVLAINKEIEHLTLKHDGH